MNREYLWEGDSATRNCLLALFGLVSDFSLKVESTRRCRTRSWKGITPVLEGWIQGMIEGHSWEWMKTVLWGRYRGREEFFFRERKFSEKGKKKRKKEKGGAGCCRRRRIFFWSPNWERFFLITGLRKGQPHHSRGRKSQPHLQVNAYTGRTIYHIVQGKFTSLREERSAGGTILQERENNPLHLAVVFFRTERKNRLWHCINTAWPNVFCELQFSELEKAPPPRCNLLPPAPKHHNRHAPIESPRVALLSTISMLQPIATCP